MHGNDKLILKASKGNDSAFTLLETTVALALSGLVMGFLFMSMHRIVEIVTLSLEKLRCAREFRMLYNFLVADCTEIAILQNQESLELNLSSLNKENCFLTIWKQRLNSSESILAVQGQISKLHTIKYSFQRKARIVMREICYQSSGGLQNGRIRESSAILNHNIARNVKSFELYPIDAWGRRQERWIVGMSVGLNCSLIFHPSNANSQQVFYAKIPVFTIGCKEPMDDTLPKKL